MEKYFAYGSNMDLVQMKTRIARLPEFKKGKLFEYELKFHKLSMKGNQEDGKGNLIPANGSIVEGLVYDVTEEELNKLDEFEGVHLGHYRRQSVSVILENNTRDTACIYIANPDKIKEGIKPSKEYLSHFLAAKKYLSKEYYEKLSKVETWD